jgi:hypothetical protein
MWGYQKKFRVPAALSSQAMLCSLLTKIKQKMRYRNNRTTYTASHADVEGNICGRDRKAISI